jgi:hypothetical protein
MLVIPRVARAVWIKDLPRFGGVNEIIELQGNKSLVAERKTIGPMGIECEEKVEGQLNDGVFLVTHECVGSWFSLLRQKKGLRMISKDIKRPPIELPRRFDYVVVDESHRYGNKGSKRALGMMKLAGLANRVILLTGTPDMGGVHKMWFQLDLLNRYGFGKYWEFVRDYGGGVETDYGYQPTKGSNLDELAQRTSPYILTYKQKDVASYLPTNTRDRILVPLTAKKAKSLGSSLEAARKALARLGESQADRQDKFLPGEVIEARKACALAKVDVCVSEAANLSKGGELSPGERCVVWTWFREVANAVSNGLAKKNVDAWVVHGGVDERGAERTINAWSRSNGVLVATIARLGEGEDRLVAAAWQYFLELDWLPQTVLQAERRLVRMSQTRPVNTRFFQLDMEFERSLLVRILTRAEDTDSLLGSSTSVDLGELFGVKNTGDMEEVLQRLGRRLG